jgi:hypothetical protein
VNGMSLKLVKTYSINATCSNNLEKVSENLILFNIEMKSDMLHFDSRPYHWRCDFGDFPPLDISLDSETGILKEITVFINRKDIRKDEECKYLFLSNMDGYPAFNTDIWKKNEYYYDEFRDVDISLFNSSLFVSIKKSNINKKLKVNDILDILLDKEGVVAGFVINNLENDEFYLFK